MSTRLKRTKKDYGSGSGKRIFHDDLFNVTVWRLANGNKTTIEVRPTTFWEINFEGEQQLNTRGECLAQLCPLELIKLINACKKQAFQAGEAAKVAEIHKALGI